MFYQAQLVALYQLLEQLHSIVELVKVLVVKEKVLRMLQRLPYQLLQADLVILLHFLRILKKTLSLVMLLYGKGLWKTCIKHKIKYFLFRFKNKTISLNLNIRFFLDLNLNLPCFIAFYVIQLIHFFSIFAYNFQILKIN